MRLRLARKGLVLTVPAGRSLLDVLLDAKVRVRHACTSGGCGACEVRVLEGVPWHRDAAYAARAVPPLDRIRLCVSRSRSAELTLDL